MTLNLTAIFGPEAADVPSDRATVSVPLVAVETGAEIADRFERDDIDIHDAPLRDRPLGPAEFCTLDDDDLIDPFDSRGSPSIQLGGLCSPPAQPFNPGRLQQVLTVCDRCQSDQYVDVPIHDGQSLRRDCRRCRRFMGFPTWYEQRMDEEVLEKH